MAIVIDTDVVIELLRHRDAGILAIWQRLVEDGEQIVFSAITMAEIYHGVRPSEEAAVAAAFSVMVCAPVNTEIARRAGEYLRTFNRSHGVELGDALIAATACEFGFPLWTRNRKHYPMKDLRLY